jgi:Xaa-Pro aminopeptidase
MQLTSEYLRKVIARELLENSCIAVHTIVACGDQGCDPHNIGSGPIFANKTIIIDIFPKSLISNYCANITRTFVRGKASEKVKRMFDAVIGAQNKAFELIKDGIDGTVIHKQVQKFFRQLGYSTKKYGNKMVGFFHGTGHGIGLEVHEPPRVSKKGMTLRKGNVITVEPGLYYFGVGAVRLEDIVVVEKDGCRNLTRFPKILEI